MTTALIVKILEQTYGDVLYNASGSNMTQGIITTLLTHKTKQKGKKIAVLEVDEGNLAFITEHVTPKAFVLTNIFRDQMDRYGEIYTTYQKIIDGIEKAPEATVIANGDAPIFNSIALPNPMVYYGFDDQPESELMAHYNTDGILCPHCHHILHYKFISYANLGSYYCPNCDFKRPTLTYKMTKRIAMTPHDSKFELDGQPFEIKIGGLYNVYNALTAYAVGRFFEVPITKIKAGLAYDERVFGRQELIKIDGKEINLVLVKNPVGLDQVIDLIETDTMPFSLVALLNANKADGIDVSWIWDGQFEKLMTNNIPAILVGGDRSADLAFRFKVAGAPEETVKVVPTLEEIVSQIKQLPTDKVYILSTYTAMLQLRKVLVAQNYIKEVN